MKFDDIELSNRIVDRFKKEGFDTNVAHAKAVGQLSALLKFALDGDVAYVECRVKELMAIEPKGE